MARLGYFLSNSEGQKGLEVSYKRIYKMPLTAFFSHALIFIKKENFFPYTLPSLIVGGGPITDFLIFCHRFPLISTPPIYIKFRKILNPLIIRNPPNLRKIFLPNGIFPAITKKIQKNLIQKSV